MKKMILVLLFFIIISKLFSIPFGLPYSSSPNSLNYGIFDEGKSLQKNEYMFGGFFSFTLTPVLFFSLHANLGFKCRIGLGKGFEYGYLTGVGFATIDSGFFKPEPSSPFYLANAVSYIPIYFNFNIKKEIGNKKNWYYSYKIDWGNDFLIPLSFYDQTSYLVANFLIKNSFLFGFYNPRNTFNFNFVPYLTNSITFGPSLINEFFITTIGIGNEFSFHFFKPEKKFHFFFITDFTLDVLLRPHPEVTISPYIAFNIGFNFGFFIKDKKRENQKTSLD